MLRRHPKVYNPSYVPEKKQFSKVYIYFLVILILLVGLVYVLFYATFFKIKNVTLENSHNLEIGQFIQKLNGHNIFFLNTAKTEAELTQKFPAVKGVKIIRGLPNTLKIQLQEEAAKAIWQTQGKNYLVSASGKIYQETEEQVDLLIIKDNNNLVVSFGQQVVSENFLNFISELSSAFNQVTGFQINHFEINETLFQTDAVTFQNWKVIFETTRKASSQLSDLAKFLADYKNEVTEYIDLRIEGKVFYK